jgi:O-antigen/teichoic acid export membrane protein
VNIVIGFLLTPFLITSLGKNNYGIWALVGSFVGYYGLIRLGVGASLMRYVPFYMSSNDPKKASEIVSTGMALFLAIGLLIIAVSLLLAKPFARFYEGGSELAWLMRILGLAAAIECITRILDATVRSQERWVEANLVTISVSIAQAIGVAGCLYLGYGLVAMGCVTLAVGFLQLALLSLLFTRICPTIHLRLSMANLSNVRSLLSFGIKTTVISLVYSLSLQGHSLIIGKVISLEAVAIYAIPALIMRHGRALSVAPARVFWPRFAYLDGKNHSEKVASLFLRGARVTAIFGTGIIFIAVVTGPPFIHLWVGENFRAAYPILLLLAGGYLIDNSQAIMPHLLAGTGHQGMQAIFACVEGVIGFGLSIILTWKLGLVGCPFGFVIAIALTRGLICPWYTCRLLNIGIIRYYTKCLLRPWLILLVLAIVMYSVGLPGRVFSWPGLVIYVLGSGCLYVLCVCAFAVNGDDRKNALRYMEKLYRRIPAPTCAKE